MKKIMFSLRRGFVWLLTGFVYLWGSIFYDKKYLVGANFDRFHWTQGWTWILRCWFRQKVSGYNRHVPWPVPPHVCISVPENIIFDPNDMRIFHSTGNYFQGINGKIYIGSGCTIAAGTGFITSNHDFRDTHRSAPGKDIVLGDNCWIGMNAVLLPGVILGPGTVVGAGSVVTKSFPEGSCIIAGNPARFIRKLEGEKREA